MSGFRFSLYSAEMNELGEFETTVPNWSTGDEFLMGDGRRFRIVGIVPFPGADDVPFNAFWKVKPVTNRRGERQPAATVVRPTPLAP